MIRKLGIVIGIIFISWMVKYKFFLIFVFDIVLSLVMNLLYIGDQEMGILLIVIVVIFKVVNLVWFFDGLVCVFEDCNFELEKYE